MTTNEVEAWKVTWQAVKRERARREALGICTCGCGLTRTAAVR